MTEEEIKKWVKVHKKKIAAEYVSGFCRKKSHPPYAFFMAGLPGAGKTEFSKNLLTTFEAENVLRLDMDEIAGLIPCYVPEKADLFRSGATELLSRIFDLAIKNKINFLLDGTFGGKYALENIKRAQKAGYTIKIFYILQEPKVAWNFTKQRELVEHRSIKLDGFIESYFGTANNILTILKQNYDKISIDIIRKEERNKIINQIQDISFVDMEKIANDEIRCYNKKTLLEYLR